MQGGYFKTKKIHVFINGHTQSKAFNIHPRCRLGWNAILDCFSKTLKPNFGAIRVLRTIDGRKVIEGFNDLKHEGKYVACGLEAFRAVKGGYLTSAEIRLKTKPTEYYPTEILSPDDQKKYPCLIQTMRKGRILIYVFANGKKADPKKIVLIKSDYEVWDSILKHIGNILDIPEGVKGLYTVFGQPLCSPYDIQHGGFYVAIPYNATFKPMKYLTARKINSHHEFSPMITKETYIAAAKTCTTIGGSPRNRLRSKTTKVKDTSKVENIESADEDSFEHHVRIEGTAIRKKEEVVHENEMNVSNYFQKEEFTQTSTILFEAICDDDHALFLNEKKYFLVPERELERFGSVDKSGWYEGLLQDSTGAFRIQHTLEDKKEITMLAGTIVGVITKVSEKIANKCVFGQSDSEINSGGVSLIAETFQPKRQSIELVQDECSSVEDKEGRQSISSRDRSLRLSVPIGRISKTKHNENSSMESSSYSFETTEIIHDLDKEYKPLTPTHNLGTSAQDLLSDTSDDDLVKKGSSLLKHLKKDSVGIPTIDKDPEIDYNEESSDEWKKLDILDDMEIAFTDEIDDGEDLELLLQEAEYYGDDDNPLEEYTFSDGAESIELTENTDSSYSNLQKDSENDPDEIEYCKRCYAHLKAKKVDKQQDDETEDQTYGKAEATSESYQDEQDECNTKFSKDKMSAKKSIAEDDIKDSSLDCPEHVVGVVSDMESLPADEDSKTWMDRTIVLENDEECGKSSTKENNSVLLTTKEETYTPISSETTKTSFTEKNESSEPTKNKVVPNDNNSIRQDSATLEFIDEIDEKEWQTSEFKIVFSAQSPVYELSSVYSQPVDNLILSEHTECFKPNVESLEVKKGTVNNWDESIEPVLRSKIEDNMVISCNEDEYAELTENGENHGIDNRVESTEYSTQCSMEKNLADDLNVPIEVNQSDEQFEKSQDQEIEEIVTTKEYSLLYSPMKKIEDDRRSLMNFLKMRIESALNTSLLDLQND